MKSDPLLGDFTQTSKLRAPFVVPIERNPRKGGWKLLQTRDGEAEYNKVVRSTVSVNQREPSPVFGFHVDRQQTRIKRGSKQGMCIAGPRTPGENPTHDRQSFKSINKQGDLNRDSRRVFAVTVDGRKQKGGFGSHNPKSVGLIFSRRIPNGLGRYFENRRALFGS